MEARNNGMSKTPIGQKVLVYYAEIPRGVTIQNVDPAERAEEISACSNADVACRKHCVWKLLDSVFYKLFGVGTEGMDCFKKGGKWYSSKACFSLSHSANAVAVAVSSHSVGVDVQLFDPARFGRRLADRILTQSEKKEYESLSEDGRPRFLAEHWGAKESVYKMSDLSVPLSQIDCGGYGAKSVFAEIAGAVYVLTAVGETADAVEFVRASCV